MRTFLLISFGIEQFYLELSANLYILIMVVMVSVLFSTNIYVQILTNVVIGIMSYGVSGFAVKGLLWVPSFLYMLYLICLDGLDYMVVEWIVNLYLATLKMYSRYSRTTRSKKSSCVIGVKASLTWRMSETVLNQMPPSGLFFKKSSHMALSSRSIVDGTAILSHID